MFQIDKQFEFCYGHRVHNQHLDNSLSDGLCSCRRIHGHNGIVKIGLQADQLERGMVTDFKNLEVIKRLVDDVLDHKFIIDIDDPLFDSLFNNCKNHLVWDDNNIGTVSPDFINNTQQELEYSGTDDAIIEAIRDKLEGLVVVKFVPTSENLCRMFAEIANTKLAKLFGSRVKVSYVDFWETPKSHCRYTP